MNNIIEFIYRRFDKDCHWLDGNCYWFAHILCSQFPQLKIWYLPISGHFIAGDSKNFYDASGLVVTNEEKIDLEKLKDDDILWYNRLMRDCKD